MERKKKVLTEEEAYSRLATICSRAEYCATDMREKMRAWELPEGAEERVMARLTNERFIDEARYARAFVRDKFRYNHWGLVRIAYQLRLKKIPSQLIEDALTEINEEENSDSLRKFLASKRKQIKKEMPEREVRTKLIRAALTKGFCMDSIMQALDSEPEYSDDDPE